MIADEAQFLTPEQIEQLARIVDELDLDVFAFGITTDFRSKLFPGSRRLVELADRIEVLQVEALCWCGARATHNARTAGGQMVVEGDQVVVGDVQAADSEFGYEVLCRRHHRRRQTAARPGSGHRLRPRPGEWPRAAGRFPGAETRNPAAMHSDAQHDTQDTPDDGKAPCPPLAELLDRLGDLTALDACVGPLQRAVRALPPGAFRDLLHGRPLGHPLHPALVHLPVGAWLSAAVLDTLPGAERGARTLVGVGVLSALPASLAGWADWAEQHERQMRSGLVHAASNIAAVALYAGSWAARGSGRRGLGKALGLAGLSAAGFGGLLGGHLAYRQASGSNKAEPVPHLLEPEWYDLGPLDELPVGEPARRTAGEVPLLVVRATDAVRVLADRCSHFSGPLSDGDLADGCVTCPWHGSVFRLSDGKNVRGPAIAPQPVFETRVTDAGALEVRLPGAG